MISRRVPSYSPMARARVTSGEWPEQFGQSPSLRAIGSPHRSHSGGVIGWTDAQQVGQTHPDKGSCRSVLHTAQAGASSAVNAALTQVGIRDLGPGISVVRLLTVVTLVTGDAC
jgi:hypothetical protein